MSIDYVRLEFRFLFTYVAAVALRCDQYPYSVQTVILSSRSIHAGTDLRRALASCSSIRCLAGTGEPAAGAPPVRTCSGQWSHSSSSTRIEFPSRLVG